MEESQDSCLSTLFSKTSLAALQLCNSRCFNLAMIEKAAYADYGNWLPTNASANYIISQFDSDSNTGGTTTRGPGCKVCIVSLPWGRELQGPNIHLRSDLAMFAIHPPRVQDIVLPAPLNYLFSKLPLLHGLPRVVSAESAKLVLLENLLIKLGQLPEYKRRNLDEIDKIATPIISGVTAIHLQLSSRLDATVWWRTYFIWAIFSLLSFAFYLLISYLFAKCQNSLPFSVSPNALRSWNKNISVTAVTPEDNEYLPLFDR